MKRTDAKVRQRCREVYGAEWYATNKRARQDEAIAFLATPSLSVDVDVAQLADLVKKARPTATIESITRVDTKGMQPSYDALLDTFDDKTVRRWLFHGTTADAVSSISLGGFNRSYCGRNATVYGRGVYFARDLSYSAHTTYSPPDENGVKTIIAASVLTGRSRCGASHDIEPGIKEGIAYHSTVDHVGDPAIFVVYKDFQAIPEYLIRLR